MDDVGDCKKFGRFLDAGGRTMVAWILSAAEEMFLKCWKLQGIRGKRKCVMTMVSEGGNYCPNTSFLATVDTNMCCKICSSKSCRGMDMNSYNGVCGERLRKQALSKPVQSYRIITKLEQKALAVAAVHKKKQDAQFPRIQTSELWDRRSG